MRSRRGKSLIEMLVVIATMSVLLGFVAQTLHALMQAERVGTQSLAQSVSLSRLSRQFRQDVHAARQAERTPAGDGQHGPLRLSWPDGVTVVWSAAEESFIRSVQRGDQVNGQEHYHIGRGAYRFDLSDDGRRAALVVEPPDAALDITARRIRQTGPKSLRIEAVTGRDLRFAAQLSPPEE